MKIMKYVKKKNFVPQHFPFWKQYDIIYKER